MSGARALIVSLNPAIDCEWRVPQVRWEEKNNILEERRWAGGKGSNVARWLQHLGGNPELLLPLGGTAGDELAGYLKGAGVQCRTVRLKGATRVNVIVTSNSGQLRFNPLGPVISRVEWRQLLSRLRTFCVAQRPARQLPLVILSGALPRGVPVTAYRKMIETAQKQGVDAFLDCDGAAFAAGIKAKPFLVKPNHHELAEWFGKPFNLRRAVTELSNITRGWVLVSQGSAGALIWNSQLRSGFVARSPKVTVRNTVGAGDALMAAVIHRVQLSEPTRYREEAENWLRWAVATGTACVQNPGGTLASAAQIRRLAKKVSIKPLWPA